MPQAILLDMYDTIVTARWSDLQDQMAKRMGVPVASVRKGYRTNSAALLTGAFESVEEELAAVATTACGDPPSDSLVADLAEIESTFFATQVVLFADTVPTIKSLRYGGTAVAVISNCSSTTEPLVRRLGLEDLVDVVVLSHQFGSAKPDAPIYEHALDLLGVPAADALFVDDQVPYLDGARRVGLATAQMAHAASPNTSPISGEHVVITDVATLLDF